MSEKPQRVGGLKFGKCINFWSSNNPKISAYCRKFRSKKLILLYYTATLLYGLAYSHNLKQRNLICDLQNMSAQSDNELHNNYPRLELKYSAYCL